MNSRSASISRFAMRFAAAALLLLANALGAAPVVLLISLDGFRWDYPEIHRAPNIRAIIEHGVRAEGLIPSYPSYTFPNHYSIVTGLRPESHGIIGNDMYEPEWDAWFAIGSHPAAREGRWWKGEPIWLTATRQGRRSASYFWPGSEADIQGEFPTWWYRYDGKVPFETRFAELMHWLTLPADERPAVVTFYFEETDTAGHAFGPGDPRTGEAVALVDAHIGRIVDAIAAAGIEDEVNIILVSDHGMTDTTVDRVFVLSERLGPEDAQIDFRGSFAGIRPKGLDVDTIVVRLDGANPHIHVYRKDEIPARLHYRANSRIPPILLIADEGWQIERKPPDPVYYDTKKRGSHGFDNALLSMRGIFIAAGPSFPKGRTLPAFENIHIYNLLCALARLEPAANEGDDRLVRWIIEGEKP